MSKETQNVDIVDVAVIGAGPTGLFAAFYAGMREISVKVIESMPQLGGQLSALYPEKYIYDVAGFPKIRAQKLVDQLVEQANLFDPIYCLDEKVESVQKNSDGIFEVRTQKEIHLAKAVLITAGVGAFQPRRLTLPNAEKFEEKNLFYFINDLEQFRDKEVLIAGGGDSAVDWALMLEPIARQVTLVHRRDRFRAHESSVNQMKSSRVRILTPYEVESLYGETSIEKVRIRDSKEGIEEELKVDAVIVSFGFISALGPIKDWGLNIEKNSIVVNSKMETNIPGIYAAGDITTYPGKVKLIAVGFGEAPTAINNAKLYIDPEARLQPGHSSNMNL